MTVVANLESSSEAVLVRAARRGGHSARLPCQSRTAASPLWDWLFKVDGAVRAFLVIVGHELAEDALGMVFASN